MWIENEKVKYNLQAASSDASFIQESDEILYCGIRQGPWNEFLKTKCVLSKTKQTSPGGTWYSSQLTRSKLTRPVVGRLAA